MPAGCWQQTLDAVKLAPAPPRTEHPPGSSWRHSRSSPRGHRWVALRLLRAAARRASRGGERPQGNLSPLPPPARLWLPDLNPTAPRRTAQHGHPAFWERKPSSLQDTPHTSSPGRWPLGRLLGGRPSEPAWQPERVAPAAVGTRGRMGPSLAEARHLAARVSTLSRCFLTFRKRLGTSPSRYWVSQRQNYMPGREVKTCTGNTRAEEEKKSPGLI